MTREINIIQTEEKIKVEIKLLDISKNVLSHCLLERNKKELNTMLSSKDCSIDLIELADEILKLEILKLK